MHAYCFGGQRTSLCSQFSPFTFNWENWGLESGHWVCTARASTYWATLSVLLNNLALNKTSFGSQEARWVAVWSSPCSGLRAPAYLTFLISSVTFPCNKHVSALSEPVPIIPPAKLFLKFILILCPGLFFCPAWLKLESSGKSKSQLRKLAELRKWLHRIDCRQVEGIFLVNGCCG